MNNMQKILWHYFTVDCTSHQFPISRKPGWIFIMPVTAVGALPSKAFFIPLANVPNALLNLIHMKIRGRTYLFGLATMRKSLSWVASKVLRSSWSSQISETITEYCDEKCESLFKLCYDKFSTVLCKETFFKAQWGGKFTLRHTL